ncbi:MAG: tRNA pseudouridine(55) synthase TruB [Planctomycetota bacterium]
MNGMIVVDKPINWTSMDVVARVRRSARDGMRASGHPIKRVKCGHAGTLDPLATGVLVCGIGRATKRMAEVMGQTKRYVAGICLAGFTPTDDAEGQAELTRVPTDTPPTSEQLDAALLTLTGDILQAPPAYSAIHINGRRAYERVRAGQDVRLEPRPVRVDRIDVLDYAFPDLTLDISCGKGTYIRSLARDLGRALGTGGYLTSLRRTAVGGFTLDQAFPIERFESPLDEDDLIPIDTPDADMPA